jgi:heat shock protein 5
VSRTDLGNSYSRVSVEVGMRIHMITNEYGHRSTPSWVAFGDEGILIGDPARDAFQSNPENTVFNVVQLLGRTVDDESFQQDLKHWPFKVEEKNGKPVINVQYRYESRYLFPEEIAGMLLGKMKEMAEVYLSQNVTNAFVTVPGCTYLEI